MYTTRRMISVQEGESEWKHSRWLLYITFQFVLTSIMAYRAETDSDKTRIQAGEIRPLGIIVTKNT